MSTEKWVRLAVYGALSAVVANYLANKVKAP